MIVLSASCRAMASITSWNGVRHPTKFHPDILLPRCIANVKSVGNFFYRSSLSCFCLEKFALNNMQISCLCMTSQCIMNLKQHSF